MKALNKCEMMGQYPIDEEYIQLEFQIDRRLIWIRCRPEMSEDECLRLGNLMFPAAWEDISAAIELAESVSRLRIPEFWAAHDNSGLVGNRLDVWSVALTPDKNLVTYEISRNHGFDFGATVYLPDPEDIFEDHLLTCLPEFPEKHVFIVDGNTDGSLRIQPSARTSATLHT
jgi:hypothetical protein